MQDGTPPEIMSWLRKIRALEIHRSPARRKERPQREMKAARLDLRCARCAAKPVEEHARFSCAACRSMCVGVVRTMCWRGAWATLTARRQAKARESTYSTQSATARVCKHHRVAGGPRCSKACSLWGPEARPWPCGHPRNESSEGSCDAWRLRELSSIAGGFGGVPRAGRPRRRVRSSRDGSPLVWCPSSSLPEGENHHFPLALACPPCLAAYLPAPNSSSQAHARPHTILVRRSCTRTTRAPSRPTRRSPADPRYHTRALTSTHVGEAFRAAAHDRINNHCAPVIRTQLDHT